jgi:hypothetical protein
VRKIVVGLMVLLCVATASLAAAQTSDKAVAEALFREGRKLMDEGKTAEACVRFENSQKLDPSTGTLLNLALCHEALGKTASAWAELNEALTQAERDKHDKRIAFAKKRIAALEPRLARLRVKFATPVDESVEVRIDGVVLSAGALSSPVPIDPGSHELEVTAMGKVPWTNAFEIEEGTTVDLLVPELSPVPAPPPPPPPVLPPPPPPLPKVPAPPPRAAKAEASISPLVWVGFGIVAAGLVVGGVTGGLALSRGGDVLDACDGDVCPAELESDHAEAVTLANVSNVSFAVSGAGLVLGIVGLIVSDFGGSEDSAWRMGPRGLRVAF